MTAGEILGRAFIFAGRNGWDLPGSGESLFITPFGSLGFYRNPSDLYLTFLARDESDEVIFTLRLSFPDFKVASYGYNELSEEKDKIFSFIVFVFSEHPNFSAILESLTGEISAHDVAISMSSLD